jgi:ankyrin repeat protein
MSLPPSPQDDDSIITQFKPEDEQWELNDDNINRIDPESGKNILHNYCQHINTTPLGVYRYLIETKGCDVNAQDNCNFIPLHDALYYFNPNLGVDIKILMYLLNQENGSANIKNKYAETMLHYACFNINNLPPDVFKVLIETLDCDVNAQDQYNDTPLHYAIYHASSSPDNITVLSYLLSQTKVDFNIKGADGYTLLHGACGNINYLPLEIFKMLIETMGCDVNAQDNDKNTPIHCAFQKFDPNQGGGDGITVLLYLLGHEDANVNIKNEKGCNLLHFTCINNFADIDDSAELNGEYDTVLCQVVEFITERWIQLILDEATP